MHLLLAAKAPRDEDGAVDLGQSCGDIVILSAADSDLACLAAAYRRLDLAFPTLRLANLMRLGHPVSVDLHVDAVLARANIVVVRLLGGVGYWRYGVERLVDLAQRGEIALALLPGDGSPDPELDRLSTIPADQLEALSRCFVEGGVDNAGRALHRLARLIGQDFAAEPAIPVPRIGRFGHPVDAQDRPIVPILFYRALVLSGDTAPVEALADAITARGGAALPVFVPSLKDSEADRFLDQFFAEHPPAVIVNLTGFATGALDGPAAEGALTRADCVVLQAVLSSGEMAPWQEGTRGLGPRDIAMGVALPEIDGRVFAGAISFKEPQTRDPATEADIALHAPVPDLVDHVADLAMGWARLRGRAVETRRVGVVLANYPVRDGRLANGVGLDTPAGTVEMLRAMRDAGYDLPDLPADGADLMARILAGPTNVLTERGERAASLTLPLDRYRALFAALPKPARDAVTQRWGDAGDDPHIIATEAGPAFALAGFALAAVAVLVQPARGYHIDPQRSAHDPDLAPPHAYLATYLWLRHDFAADAVIHMGKHGTLEWLPGKALALSPACLPQAILGPLPQLYPFIVNDPGEGTQAKRRTAAIVIDHLTPPLTRAESYGPLRDLERLIDEYYEASTLDPRRLKPLSRDILDLAQRSGLAAECGIHPGIATEAALVRLDAFLCDIKELQIRDGLHVFGRSPTGDLLIDLLVALTRVPRRQGRDGDASLIRALAEDLDLGFDPLACDLAAPWTGPRPDDLARASEDAWRITGDTVERLELLARALVAGVVAGDPIGQAAWPRGGAVLAWIRNDLAQRVTACGGAEIAGVVRGLAGRHVAPGPSGAPTRGRPETLPTGRNFYSVDTRALPTPAAWRLGWHSAQLLVERHAQDFGTPLRRMALSAWGTATMRTGGDDIAQCLALMGVRPVWDASSNRVTGFEIIPLSLLDRPRVDVTLRVSGFFRDAFPGLVDLVDRAARAVAALDEPDADNPLAASVRASMAEMVASGMAPDLARKRAGFRVFGAKPGAYGAGLQGLIDSDAWRDPAELSDAFLAWSGWAYGSDGDGGAAEGAPARERLEGLLGRVQAVVHNQDNREHDLLDSDDYYQFEGGLAVAAKTLSGSAPAIYHTDHARPERPVIRRLEEELARVIRGRAANPKWLAGVKRHGYKGAAEIAATLDYLFAFQATTGLVTQAQFEAVYAAWIEDAEIREFIATTNPAALREIAQRFEDAIRRGYWQPRSNTAADSLQSLAGGQKEAL